MKDPRLKEIQVILRTLTLEGKIDKTNYERAYELLKDVDAHPPAIPERC